MNVITSVGVVEPVSPSTEISIDVRAEWPDAPERLARTDRVCHLALLAAFRALGRPTLEEREMAVVYGSSLASLTTNVRFYEKIVRRGFRLADPKRFPYTAPNAAAGEVAIAFRMIGANITVTPGFHSGIDAVVVADRLVSTGRAAAALAVAADAHSEEVAKLLDEAGVISLAGAAREGAVALVIEPLGAPGARCRIERVAQGVGKPKDGPVTLEPGVVAAIELADAIGRGIAFDRTVQCPLTGAWAAVSVTPS